MWARASKRIRQSKSQARKGIRRAADPHAFCDRYVVPGRTRARRAADPPLSSRLLGLLARQTRWICRLAGNRANLEPFARFCRPGRHAGSGKRTTLKPSARFRRPSRHAGLGKRTILEPFARFCRPGKHVGSGTRTTLELFARFGAPGSRAGSGKSTTLQPFARFSTVLVVPEGTPDLKPPRSRAVCLVWWSRLARRV